MAVEQKLTQVRSIGAEWLARGAGVALAVSGIVTSGYGMYDLNTNTQPKIEGFNDDLDEKYPLVNLVNFQDAKNKIADFETKSRELIKKGQASQIPKLAQDTTVVKDYQKVDQQNINEAIRTDLYKNSGLKYRHTINIFALFGGLIPLILSPRLILSRKVKPDNTAVTNL